MPAPTTPVLDTGSGAAASLGAPNWGLIFAADQALRRDGSGHITAAATPANSESRWILNSFAQNQESYCTISTLPGASSYVALYTRISAQDGTGYEFEMDTPASGSTMAWKIMRFANSASFTELTPTGGVSAAAAAGDQMMAQSSGDTHTISQNGATLISRVDSTYRQSGYIGLQLNDATVRITNFGGGATVAGGAPVPARPLMMRLWMMMLRWLPMRFGQVDGQDVGGPAVNNVAASDTLLTVADAGLLRVVQRAQPADTLLTVADTVAIRATRPLADTLLAVSDQVASARARAVADTLLSPADVVAVAVNRAVTDTLLTMSDQVAGGRTFARTATDTLLAVTDTLTVLVGRKLADTLMTPSDTLNMVAGRRFADTLLAPADTLVPRATRPLADTLTAGLTSTVVMRATRPIADTLLTPSDALVGGRTFFRTPGADTLLTVADAVIPNVTRAVADTLLALSPALAVAVTRQLASTLLTPGDSITRQLGHAVTASDTLLSLADIIGTRPIRVMADTLLSTADAAAVRAVRLIADTALAVSDQLAKQTVRAAAASDTLLAVGSTVAARASRVIADTLLTVTDQVARGRAAIPVAVADTLLTVVDTVAVNVRRPGPWDATVGHLVASATLSRVSPDTTTARTAAATTDGSSVRPDADISHGRPIDSTLARL